MESMSGGHTLAETSRQLRLLRDAICHTGWQEIPSLCCGQVAIPSLISSFTWTQNTGNWTQGSFSIRSYTHHASSLQPGKRDQSDGASAPKRAPTIRLNGLVGPDLMRVW